MKAPDSLSSNIIYQCGEFSHKVHQLLTKQLKENNIPVTVEQFSVLATLFYQDGISQQAISDVLGRDKTTMARVISIMERDKLIMRAANKNDNRGKLIFLSKKGRLIQHRAVGVAGQLYMRAIGNLKESQIKAAINTMMAMTANLSREE